MPPTPFFENNPYTAQLAGTSSSMYNGVPLYRNQIFDLSGFPGLNGNQGLMLQMMLQPMIASFMGSNGFMPGQFQPVQNLYDHQRAQQVFLQNVQATQAAAQADRTLYANVLRGASYLTGIQPNDQAINAMTGDMAQFTPFIAMAAPDLFDQLHGRRGSAQVMAHHLHMGGRFARDPVTGLTGLSGATAGKFATELYEGLYGPKADVDEMRGLRAGDVGRMYDELNRKGFLGTALSSEERHSVAERYTGKKVLSTTEVDQLFESNSGAQDELRVTELQRIKKRLPALAGVIAAMRDIFGDLGKPNAPIPDIINALQALTQGGLSNMSPQDLEMTVRKTYNLSKVTGAGIDNVARLLGNGAQLANSMGLDPQHTVNATLGALATGEAYKRFGRGDVPYYGRPTADQVTFSDQQLRLSAAQSPMAQQINTLAYLADTLPGQATKGSEAAAMLDAVRKGQTEYLYAGPQGMMRGTLAKNQQELLDVLDKGGYSRSITMPILANAEGLQDVALRYDTASTVRKMQRETDILPAIYARTSSTIDANIQDRVKDPRQRHAMTSAAARAAMDMTNVQYADTKTRNRTIAEAMQASSDGKYTVEELIPTAAMLYPAYERLAKERANKSFGAWREDFNQRYQQDRGGAEDLKREVTALSDLQVRTSHLGKGTPLSRLVDVFTEGNIQNKSLGQVMSELLGGIKPADALKAGMKAVNNPLSLIASPTTSNFSDADKRAQLLQEFLQHGPQLANFAQTQGLTFSSFGDLIKKLGSNKGPMPAEIRRIIDQLQPALGSGVNVVSASPADPAAVGGGTSTDATRPGLSRKTQDVRVVSGTVELKLPNMLRIFDWALAPLSEAVGSDAVAHSGSFLPMG